MAAMVGGVIVDESVLLLADKSSGLLPEAHTLLRKLRHSSILTAISHGPALDPHLVKLLEDIALQYSLHCFILDADDVINQVKLAWPEIGGTILYLVSDNKKDNFPKLIKNGWMLAALKVEGSNACENPSMMYLDTLVEFPLKICHLNKKAIGDSVVTVGYIMKPSREEDFVKTNSLGSFSEELARLLRTDEEDDAISPLKEHLPAKLESDPQNPHWGNMMQFTEKSVGVEENEDKEEINER